jgi:hypothetical protein
MEWPLLAAKRSFVEFYKTFDLGAVNPCVKRVFQGGQVAQNNS